MILFPWYLIWIQPVIQLQIWGSSHLKFGITRQRFCFSRRTVTRDMRPGTGRSWGEGQTAQLSRVTFSISGYRIIWIWPESLPKYQRSVYEWNLSRETALPAKYSFLKIVVVVVMKLMDYGESKEDTLLKIVRRQQHHTNSTLLQIVKNFKKSFKVKWNK
jgi:hypothetical protein